LPCLLAADEWQSNGKKCRRLSSIPFEDAARGAKTEETDMRSGLRLFAFLWWGMAMTAASQAGAGQATAQAERPWFDRSLSSDQRASALLGAMTQDEKFGMVWGYFGSVHVEPRRIMPPPDAKMGSAGYVPGIPRLGVPPLWQTDAGLGVATQRESAGPYREGTSLPSGLAAAASWNPDLAREGGAMIADEARAFGFNVLLAGAVNLTREPRNGRNFEYPGEDPLLAGIIVGAHIQGIQSRHVLSTIKHWALNAQETGRAHVSADIPDDQARVSDFLAFQIAIERSAPGAVMCAYNRVGGVYACESDYLLNQVLKGDWGYKGFVLSDWGAVHSTAAAANAGLDQQSAYSFDKQHFFGPPLREAVAKGEVAQARLDDMVLRIARAMIDKGLFDHPVREGERIDVAAHAAITRTAAEQGIVLLKNDDAILPLRPDRLKQIAIIGGHADKGVMAGGGSSTVFPRGGNAVPGLGPTGVWYGPIVFHPSPPLAAIARRLPQATVRYHDGQDKVAAAKLAAQSDLVLVFGTQWTSEDTDAALSLDGAQDALIAAILDANPRSVVVLETGGPVLMPWVDKAKGLLAAWYPGTEGGEAIARVLFGETDASGRLPLTFPRSLDQLPRPRLDGLDLPKGTAFNVDYGREGAAVGYKWFDRQGLAPLFPFGHGLSYARFDYKDLQIAIRDGTAHVSFTIRNVSDRDGMDVPQLYATRKDGGWEAPQRLVGWHKLSLRKGEESRVSLTIDPRLLARFDSTAKQWVIDGGAYRLALAASSRAPRLEARFSLPARRWR
jgi:beta-glucosidase